MGRRPSPRAAIGSAARLVGAVAARTRARPRGPGRPPPRRRRARRGWRGGRRRRTGRRGPAGGGVAAGGVGADGGDRPARGARRSGRASRGRAGRRSWGRRTWTARGASPAGRHRQRLGRIGAQTRACAGQRVDAPVVARQELQRRRRIRRRQDQVRLEHDRVVVSVGGGHRTVVVRRAARVGVEVPPPAGHGEHSYPLARARVNARRSDAPCVSTAPRTARRRPGGATARAGRARLCGRAPGAPRRRRSTGGRALSRRRRPGPAACRR